MRIVELYGGESFFLQLHFAAKMMAQLILIHKGLPRRHEKQLK